jgi:hypothetical protein
VIPVLGGVVAGITVTVKSVDWPGDTDAGVAFIAANRFFPPPTHWTGAVAEFRGTEGVVVVKSAELLSVSVQPESFLVLLLLFPAAAVEVVSRKIFVTVPQATESISVPVFIPPCRMPSPPAVADKAQEQVVLLKVRSGVIAPS